MDTMISLRDNMRRLTKDEVREKCPFAFAQTPSNPGVSGKYIQANTETVMDDMMRLGWYPVEAKQCRAKKGSKGIRSFHMLAFENENVKVVNPNGGTEAYVRIILQNSHDGFSSFKFMMGLYRCVCSNGLIVADAEYASFTIRHISYTFEELRSVVNKVVDTVPTVINKMNAMNQVYLTPNQMNMLALAAYKIRKGMEENEKVQVSQATIGELLTPVRNEDHGNSLWNVYNVLQEKVIKGGFSVEGKNGKTRKQRPISSIKRDAECNQLLWAAAASFIPATMAA